MKPKTRASQNWLYRGGDYPPYFPARRGYPGQYMESTLLVLSETLSSVMSAKHTTADNEQRQRNASMSLLSDQMEVRQGRKGAISCRQFARCFRGTVWLRSRRFLGERRPYLYRRMR